MLRGAQGHIGEDGEVGSCAHTSCQGLNLGPLACALSLEQCLSVSWLLAFAALAPSSQ